jgi:hypothetical protein
MVDFPTTLIIGLGGVGSKITAEIYNKFLETNPTDIEKRNIVCLCLDTDAGDVEKRKKMLPKNWVVKTSSDLSSTVGDYLNAIKDETTVLDWFDTRSAHVIDMSLNEGAGQIRMASRLALMAAIGEEKLKTIDFAISSLLTLEPERHAGNDIKVHIISSLAGGTGAGSFLQIAYYVKDVMRNDYHINSPKITGYFILADVLCNDRSIGFNKDQIENTRSNTYACMKELDAFIHNKKVQVFKPIEFEYKRDQEDIHLPHGVPYNLCYLVDYTTRQGQNLNDSQRYYDQVRDYVYLNVFTDIGVSQRSQLINDIRQTVENDGNGAYSAIGVSKLVYPVDDIFDYFANQKVVENLSSSWVVLDEIYKKAWADYKKKLDNGEKTKEPSKDDYFRDNVVTFAKKGTGIQKTIFSKIYDSVCVLDDEMVRVRRKSSDYVKAVEKHVQEVLQANDKFQKLYENSHAPMDSFLTEDDEPNDVASIVEREEYLEKFRKYAKDVVEKLKTSSITDCFLANYEDSKYVSSNPKESKHQLNTYILEKGHEMHPIAVRFFLYDVRSVINEEVKKLKPENEDLLKQTDEMYKLNFNVTDDKNDADDEYKENAQEKLGIIYSRNKAFYKRAWQKIIGKSPIKECKEEYLKFSGIQSENIRRCAETQLLLLVFDGLLAQINRLIEESERFFGRLPETLETLKKEGDSLLIKHDNNIEPSIKYVLAESKYKKIIYEDEISSKGSVFFPEDMSAQIYRTMFKATYDALQHTRRTLALSEKQKEELWKAQIEADLLVFNEVIKSQRKTLKKESKYAKMNVIQALRDEADYAIPVGTPDRGTKLFAYMKERFDDLRQMAATRGADHVDTKENRPINSWGIHPECVEEGILSKNERAELFGLTDIGNNPLNAASQEVSPLFSKYEIIRADSINQLEISKNFQGFVATQTNEYAQGSRGVYYKAYKDVIDRIIAGSKAYSPHLDKRWHLPSYLPNIGASMDDTLNDVFRAMCYGLLFGRISVNKDYWYAISDTSDFIHDLDDKLIGVKGKSVAVAINKLFESGLANNPRLVAYLLKYCDKQWNDARENWLNTDEKTLDKMKNQPIVKKIKEFTFSKIYSATSWSYAKFDFYYVVNQSNVGMIAGNLIKLKSILFGDLIKRLISVFDPTSDTYKLCKYVFESISDNTLKNEAMNVLDQAKEKGDFDPKNI